MVKYHSELKALIVGQYLNDNFSVTVLAKKYNVPKRQILTWIQRYQLGGINTLK